MPSAAAKTASRRIRFGDLATCVNDRVDNPSEAGVERYVGLEHLDSDSLRIRRWGAPSDVEATKLLFRKGDIIFGRRRAYQRKLAVADFDGICSAHAMVLRARPETVLPEFLPFFMQSDLFMERAQAISVGSLSPTINWKTLAQEEFALPPIEEQRRLVTALGALESCLAELAHLAAAARSVRLAVSRSAFAQVARTSRPLSEFVAHSAYGPRFPGGQYSPDGDVYTIRTTDFSRTGGIDFSSVPAARLDARIVTEHQLRDGDFLLSRSGEYAGMVRVFEAQSAPAKIYIPAAFLIRFRLREGLLPQYLFEYCESPEGMAAVRSLARGSAQPNISGTSFLALSVPTPSLEQQNLVCAHLAAARQAEHLIARRIDGARATMTAFSRQHLGTGGQ